MGKGSRNRNERKTINVRGIPVEVVSDEEAEKVDFVVCVSDEFPTYFPDDVKARCALCGRAIRHRPHVPRKPPKICVKCASLTSGGNGLAA